jgi:hypothetical protein
LGKLIKIKKEVSSLEAGVRNNVRGVIEEIKSDDVMAQLTM